jgi:dolichol-phosphate mannosyltransferase
MISMVASLYANLVLWMGIRDTTAGFVCYKRSILERLDLQKIRFVGYAFQIEMKFACRQIGGRLKEVPIIFTERVEGVSKMSKNIIKEGILGVLQIRWYSLFNTYKKS